MEDMKKKHGLKGNFSVHPLHEAALYTVIYGISLSVCLFTCVYMMLVALLMCLRVGAGIVGGS